MKMNVTAYFTKETIIPRGSYTPTSLDEQKANADIVIEAHSDKYEIRVKEGIEIKGRGVERYSNGVYAIPESLMRKLEKKHTVVCNF